MMVSKILCASFASISWANLVSANKSTRRERRLASATSPLRGLNSINDTASSPSTCSVDQFEGNWFYQSQCFQTVWVRIDCSLGWCEYSERILLHNDVEPPVTYVNPTIEPNDRFVTPPSRALEEFSEEEEALWETSEEFEETWEPSSEEEPSEEELSEETPADATVVVLDPREFVSDPCPLSGFFYPSDIVYDADTDSCKIDGFIEFNITECEIGSDFDTAMAVQPIFEMSGNAEGRMDIGYTVSVPPVIEGYDVASRVAEGDAANGRRVLKELTNLHRGLRDEEPTLWSPEELVAAGQRRLSCRC